MVVDMVEIRAGAEKTRVRRRRVRERKRVEGWNMFDGTAGRQEDGGNCGRRGNGRQRPSHDVMLFDGFKTISPTVHFLT